MEIRLPIAVPSVALFVTAWFMEIGSKLSGKAPLLTTKDIAIFSGLQQDFDISKARTELGFNPKDPIQAVKKAMQYLQEKKDIFTI
ncbi:hypothetical protein D3C78_1809280 [compost metagenome]